LDRKREGKIQRTIPPSWIERLKKELAVGKRKRLCACAQMGAQGPPSGKEKKEPIILLASAPENAGPKKEGGEKKKKP